MKAVRAAAAEVDLPVIHAIKLLSMFDDISFLNLESINIHAWIYGAIGTLEVNSQ